MKARLAVFLLSVTLGLLAMTGTSAALSTNILCVTVGTTAVATFSADADLATTQAVAVRVGPSVTVCPIH